MKSCADECIPFVVARLKLNRDSVLSINGDTEKSKVRIYLTGRDQLVKVGYLAALLANFRLTIADNASQSITFFVALEFTHVLSFS